MKPAVRDTLDFLQCHHGNYRPDEIARGAGHRQSDVRKALADLVECGLVEERPAPKSVCKDSSVRDRKYFALWTSPMWRLA